MAGEIERSIPVSAEMRFSCNYGTDRSCNDNDNCERNFKITKNGKCMLATYQNLSRT